MSINVAIADYHFRLLAAGMEPREAARAAMYAEQYGFEEMQTHTDRNGCIRFAEPACETGWNCLSPEHQRFEE